jgi:hypothetical protein
MKKKDVSREKVVPVPEKGLPWAKGGSGYNIVAREGAPPEEAPPDGGS